jgi:hypothetical protein
MQQVINTEGYAYYEGLPNTRPRRTLVVTFVTDMVPGAWYEPDDLMKWIASHPYVDKVTLRSDDRSECSSCPWIESNLLGKNGY